MNLLPVLSWSTSQGSAVDTDQIKNGPNKAYTNSVLQIQLFTQLRVSMYCCFVTKIKLHWKFFTWTEV